MKRLILLLLITIIVLAACGGNEPEHTRRERRDTEGESFIPMHTKPEPNEEDIEPAVSEPEPEPEPEPLAFVNDEAEALFSLLINNMDIINADDVRGITLADLNFDGVPELIISRVFSEVVERGEGESAWTQTVNSIEADIYSPSNNTLTYIDTLYNYYMIGDGMNGNALGLKTLDNGEQAWFNMSRTDRDDSGRAGFYLFNFDGEKLDFTEVFSEDGEQLYFFSEPIEYTVVPIEDPGDPDEPYYFEHKLVWGELSAVFGQWELNGFIKADWCQDLKETTINLYSHWLSGEIRPWSSEEIVKTQLSDHEFKSNIARIINEFYTHGHIFIENYYYWFLGAYAKPVIYLYPEETTDVEVRITFPNGGRFTATYPDYGAGWNVTAHPDGTLINHADNREYSYLYWAGKGPVNWDFSSGFVVRGKDTVAFLQEKLEFLGLIPREYNEFIVYYLPLMQDNAYNLITFQTQVYEENVVMHIFPEPDSVLRIFMAYVPLDEPVNIPEQVLEPFERKGFTVIEWGGTNIY